MTAEGLLKLPCGCHRYELMKGEFLTRPPSGEEDGAVTVHLTVLSARHVKANNLRIVCGAETGLKLESDPDPDLTPEVAFIRRERVGTLSSGYSAGAPDLAVEVISPNETKSGIENKDCSMVAIRWARCMVGQPPDSNRRYAPCEPEAQAAV
jgi:Uma2 family endonuclease